MNQESIDLTPQIFKSFKAAKIFKQHSKDIVGLDFSNDGSLLYSADSTTLNVFETQQGNIFRKLFMKNHQIQQLTHTHHNEAVLVASKKGHMIFYWSIHENKVIRQFQGHKDTITGLIMCPRDDTFISTSQDNTLRLWDLNSESQSCTYVLNVEDYNVSAYPVANFDPTGLVFAAAWTEQPKDKAYSRICLFGKDACENGPFADWKFDDYSDIKILKFSRCGKLILLGTADNVIILLDSFKGVQQRRFTNFVNEASIIQCSFSPDTRYIFSGSENGVIHVWDLDGKQIVQLKKHAEKVFFVKFSPHHCLLASGGRNIIWWQPEIKKKQ